MLLVLAVFLFLFAGWAVCGFRFSPLCVRECEGSCDGEKEGKDGGRG